MLVVHSSTSAMVGFTEQPELSALAELAHAHDLLLVYDLGSGALLDTAAFGLAHEPTVQEALDAGCDLVTFSGDKLLGGPQAGLIAGRADLVTVLKKHPLARAVRADKLDLAGLVATLESYRRGTAAEELPVWQMIGADLVDSNGAPSAGGEPWGRARSSPGRARLAGAVCPARPCPPGCWPWTCPGRTPSPPACAGAIRP